MHPMSVLQTAEQHAGGADGLVRDRARIRFSLSALRMPNIER